MSFGCQNSRNLFVVDSCGCELADALLHLGVARKCRQCIYRHHDSQLCYGAAAPHNSRFHPIARAAPDDNFVNQAT